jgi:hypothetical protein
MSAFYYVATPNEVYWFAEKMRCKWCDGKLVVDAKSMKNGHTKPQLYLCMLDCPEENSLTDPHTYYCDISFDDPKHMTIAEECVGFSDDEFDYSIYFHQDNTDIHIGRVDPSDILYTRLTGNPFGDPPYTKATLVKKIDTIRLLK